jgi:low temperature requirement protein LtrA
VGTYFGIRILLHLKYNRARYYVPAARPFIFHVQIGICLGLACWVGAGLLPAPSSYYFWALALAVEILAPLVAGGIILQKRFPPDARHLPGRVATFTTLMLAQIASSIVMALYQAGIGSDSVSRTLLAGITLLGLWSSYFDRIYYTPAQALSEHQRTGPFWAWIYLHLPLTILLLLSGVGLGLTVHPKSDVTLTNWLVGAGVGGSYVITGLLALVNQWASYQLQSIRQVGIRLTLGTILILATSWTSPLLLLLLCAGTSLIMILSDRFSSSIHIDSPPTIASRFARSSNRLNTEA